MLLYPFMPTKSEAIWNALGIGKPIEKILFENEKVFYFTDDLGTIDKIKPIFPRIEE
jgi:methionyl-tRNA synthetase